MVRQYNYDLSLNDPRIDLEPSSFHIYIYSSLLSTRKNEGISLGILAMLAGPLQATRARAFQRRGSERTNDDKESEHRLGTEMTRT